MTGEEGQGRPNHGIIMPLYFFRISHGRYTGASDQGSEFESRDAAWTEMTKVCGNLLGSLSRGLKQNAEWQMELLDEAKKPVFGFDLLPNPLVSVQSHIRPAARNFTEPS